jgi:hypothetical protein
MSVKYKARRWPGPTPTGSLNVWSDDSDLRIQIQLDPRYQPFVERSSERVVLGDPLRVATAVDVLRVCDAPRAVHATAAAHGLDAATTE